MVGLFEFGLVDIDLDDLLFERGKVAAAAHS